MPEPVLVPTGGMALGARYHAQVALLYAIETALTEAGAQPGGSGDRVSGERSMNDPDKARRPGVADYPLAEKRPEWVEDRERQERSTSSRSTR